MENVEQAAALIRQALALSGMNCCTAVFGNRETGEVHTISFTSGHEEIMKLLMFAAKLEHENPGGIPVATVH